MNVCIAEKRSVAHEVATVLGANTKRNGYMRVMDMQSQLYSFISFIYWILLVRSISTNLIKYYLFII